MEVQGRHRPEVATVKWGVSTCQASPRLMVLVPNGHTCPVTQAGVGVGFGIRKMAEFGVSQKDVTEGHL